MASAPTRLMTFAEFEQLPDPSAGRYELVQGELILVPPPTNKHFATQRRLRRLLDLADNVQRGYSDTEFSFRPSGDHTYFICDVAWVTKDRWKSAAANSYFQGAPELVIEILSPSNKASEMLEKEQVSLASGATEFWIVDDELRIVKVSTPDGHTVTYRPGQAIPLFFSEGTTLPVDAIFA